MVAMSGTIVAQRGLSIAIKYQKSREQFIMNKKHMKLIDYRYNQINLRNFFKLKNNSKIYIYPNFNGIGLSLFIFFCFLISVFYESNSGLLLSIIIFFIF